MALIFNPYMFGTNGIINILSLNQFNTLIGAANRIYVYSDSVAYPTSVPSTVPFGPMITIAANVVDFQQVNGTISLIGAKVGVANLTGTISWCLLTYQTSVGGNSAGAGMICNSVSTSGEGGIFVFSTLSANNGESVALSTVNLTLGGQ
jgi:hypothetical protein